MICLSIGEAQRDTTMGDKPMGTMIDTQRQIKLFQLLTLRQAVKLECLGMKRRGKSATFIVKNMLGIKRTAKPIEVLAVMDFAISKLNQD